MATVESWRSLYPFQSHYATLGGHRCHYVDEGAGPVLLMVHGNPTWSFYWRDLIRPLKDRFRVVAIDHIGCGLSDKPSARRYSYRLAQRIADLNELIEKLGLQQITLLAHDWGGAIGMGAAVAAPERFARFALMNTAAFRSPRCPWQIRACRIPLFGPLAVQGLNLFVRAATRTTVWKRERITPAVRAGLMAPYDSWGHREAVMRFVLDIPLSPSHPSYQTLVKIEEGLAQFRQHPICLIWGMHDWCFSPAFLARFLDFWPQAEVHRLSDASHYVVEDAHEEISPLLEDFIGRHPLLPRVSAAI
jgi:cis-3-alkyl-4-acyloxetan-2-one decarboxylase